MTAPLGVSLLYIQEVVSMLISKVCQKCSLTKKAVEYYVEQGLIVPSIQENGYRSFSDEDVYKLEKISVLRSLGVSVADIRIVLSNPTATTLNEIAGKKILEITALQEKQKLIQELAENHDWEQVQIRLQQIEKKQSVLERLMNVFPGYYGRYICLHFAAYLNEPVMTDEQQEAFDTIINFLDNVTFDIPDDLQKYLNDMTVNFDDAFAERLSVNINNAIQNMEKYITDNREQIENYFAYKQSDEYKTTTAYRLEESLRQFADVSGYNDIFLPAMRRLSKSYRQYYEALLKADEKLLQLEIDTQ